MASETEAPDFLSFWRDAGGNPHTSIDDIHERAVHHSPDGYEWGYGGSGPSDLALNLLLWRTGETRFADAHAQDLKREFLVGLPREGGIIGLSELDAWIDERRRALPA